MAAALYLSQNIRFGPSDRDLVRLAADEMAEYVSTKGQLDTLIRAAKVQLTGWSLQGLREIFCRMFEPKDRTYFDDDPDAGEMRAIEESGRKFFEKIAEFKRKAIATPAAEKPPAPARSEPLPRPRVIGDRGRFMLDQESGDFRRETLKETEERIAAEAKEAAASNSRSVEDRARMIADLEAQVVARLQRK